jgi:hypothetical protein
MIGAKRGQGLQVAVGEQVLPFNGDEGMIDSFERRVLPHVR